MRSLPFSAVATLAVACGGGGTTTAPDADPGAPDAAMPVETGYFPADAVWYDDVTDAPLDPQSQDTIAWLAANGGWGTGEMRIDFSIEVLEADATTPRMSFEPTGDWFDPDCDLDPIPLPDGGNLEGETGYECVNDGDCHLIVIERDERKLYEMWRANIAGGTFYGGCLAVWDLTRVYPPSGRGEQCTSADAAGYPIAPLLFTADEIHAGEIRHAIRFILPNPRIRAGEYVHPATHGTGATSAPDPAPMYGARFRLRGDYPVDNLSPGAQVVARALQRHGMLLSDAGQIALTAQSDRRASHTWAEVGVDSFSLADLSVTDFEVVDGGERIPLTLDCVRNP